MLKENDIIFESQYKFKDCRNKNPLPFDFAVLNTDGNTICLIEYDGIGHYQPFRFSKDKIKMLKKLIQTMVNDNIKDQYCKDNRIPLLRISYWDFENIETLILDFIN